ncbi:PepSY domain-containing protein [Nonomuraea sp. NPDC050478]|uniref:PepSY domain-containing protein n=1 Tax=Nonomuraea sp. NPDC050478 TaxID=3364365 RepID=UPI00378D572B
MQTTTKIIVASAAAMALVAGGSAAFAASQDSLEGPASQSVAQTAPQVTAQQAIELALKEVPGSWVSEVDFDGRGKKTDVWEVKTIKGDVEHELDIDAVSGKLLKQETERADDDDDSDDD